MHMVNMASGMTDSTPSALISIRTQYPGMNPERLRQACLQAACNQ